MMIPGGAKINPAAPVARSYPAPSHAAVQAQKDDFARRFDSVKISEGGVSMEKELTGKLSQEVRTATSTDMIAALREQIRSGTYQPDAMEIAKKMLLLGEAV